MRQLSFTRLDDNRHRCLVPSTRQRPPAKVVSSRSYDGPYVRLG